MSTKQHLNLSDKQRSQTNYNKTTNNQYLYNSDTAVRRMTSSPIKIEEEQNNIQIQRSKLFAAMQLSNEVKDSIMLLQNYDREIQSLQRQNNIKTALEEQLKRIYRVKNHNKNFRSYVFDNELTITALCNAFRLIKQLNNQVLGKSRLQQRVKHLQGILYQSKAQSSKDLENSQIIPQQSQQQYSNEEDSEQLIKFRQLQMQRDQLQNQILQLNTKFTLQQADKVQIDLQNFFKKKFEIQESIDKFYLKRSEQSHSNSFSQLQHDIMVILEMWKKHQNWQQRFQQLVSNKSSHLLEMIGDVMTHDKVVFIDLQFLENNNHEIIEIINQFIDQVDSRNNWYENDLKIKLNLPDILPNQHLIDMLNHLRAKFRQQKEQIIQQQKDIQLLLNSLSHINLGLLNSSLSNNFETVSIFGSNPCKQQLSAIFNKTKDNIKSLVKQIIELSDNLVKLQHKEQAQSIQNLNINPASRIIIQSMEKTIKNYQNREKQILNENIRLKQIIQDNINQQKKILDRLGAESLEKQHSKERLAQLQQMLYNVTNQQQDTKQLKQYIEQLAEQINKLNQQLSAQKVAYEKQKQSWFKQKQILKTTIKQKSQFDNSNRTDESILQQKIKYLENQLEETRQFYEQEKQALQSHNEKLNENIVNIIKQQQNQKIKNENIRIQQQNKCNDLNSTINNKQRQVQSLREQLKAYQQILRENQSKLENVSNKNKMLLSELAEKENQLIQLQVKNQQISQLKSVIQIYKNSQVKKSKNQNSQIKTFQDLPDKFNELKIKYRRQIGDYKASILRLQAANQNVKRENSFLESKFNSIQSKLQIVENELAKYMIELKQKTAKISELQISMRQQQTLAKNVAAFKDKQHETVVQNLQKTNQNYLSQITSLKQQKNDILSNNQQNLKRLQTITSQLRQLKINKEQQIKHHQKNIEQIKLQLMEKNSEVSNLKKQLENFHQQLASRQRQQKISTFAQEDVKLYKRQIQQLRRTLQNKQLQLHNKQIKIQSVSRQLSNLREKNDEQIVKLHNMLIDQNQNLYQQIDEKLTKALSQNNQLKTKLISLESSLKNKSYQLEQNELIINQLKNKNAILNNQIQQLSSQKNKLDILLNKTSKQKEIQTQQFNEYKKKIENQIYQLNRAKQRSIEQTQKLQQTIEELNLRNHELMRQHKNLKNSERQLEQLRNEFGNLRNSISKYQQEINLKNNQHQHQSVYDIKINELQLEINRLRQNNTLLDTQINQYKNTVSKKNKQISEMNQQLIQLKIKLKQEQSGQSIKLPINEQNKIYKIKFQQCLQEIKQLKQNIFSIHKDHEEMLYEIHKQNNLKIEQNNILLTKRSQTISKLQWQVKSLNSTLQAINEKHKKVSQQNEQIRQSHQKLSVINKQLRKCGEENLSKIKKLSEVKNELKRENHSLKEKLQNEILQQNKLKEQIKSIKQKSEQQRKKLQYDKDLEQRKNFDIMQENMILKRQLGQLQIKLEDNLDQMKMQHQELLSFQKYIDQSNSKIRYYEQMNEEKEKRLFQSKQNISKLREIAQMLDNRIYQQNASEFNLLMVISQEIQFLIDKNKHLKAKCDQLMRNGNHSPSVQFCQALQNTIQQVIDFILDEKMVPQANMNFENKMLGLDEYDNKVKYFNTLTNFLKELLKKVWQERMQGFSNYKSLIHQIKDLIATHLEHGDQTSLAALQNLLKRH